MDKLIERSYSMGRQPVTINYVKGTLKLWMQVCITSIISFFIFV